MDPIKNPFTPGAGAPPPALVGRDDLLDSARIAVERVRQGRPVQSMLMVGLRGVGKTVLLDRMREDAESRGIQTLRIEAPENRSLPAILSPQLKIALLQLSRTERAKKRAQRALRALAGFVGALKAKYQDIEVRLDFEPEPGLADNGDLELDLQSLLDAAGEAARHGQTAMAVYLDEMQYIKEDELAALITALHRASQRTLPVVLVGAGLPQLRGRMGRAKSYAERLFTFPEVGPLPEAEAKIAIAKPASEQGAAVAEDALDLIVSQTRGYPYFLQEWGKHSWDSASASPIRIEDVQAASRIAIAALDESFFRVRFDRLTPAEKRYLRAMAALGPGPHRSGDIADCLDRQVTSLGPLRSSLISKGMVWSPQYGDTAFTVPLFDEFMIRMMPGEDWRRARGR